MGAVALVGSDRLANVADRMVPRGAMVGAMAIAWSRQTSELEDVLRPVGGMTESDAVVCLIRTVSHLASAGCILDGFFCRVAGSARVGCSRCELASC